MNVGKSKPYAILVFGAPMSGKTCFAEQFSASIKAPYLNFSQLAKKHNLDRETALTIMRQLAISKGTVIIEGMMDKESDRSEIRKIFKDAGYTPIMIWIQTDLNTIKQRMRHAYKTLQAAKAAFAKSYENIEAPSETEEHIVISGKHTYQTQYKNVTNSLSDTNN